MTLRNPLLLLSLIPLTACGLSDFAAKQAAWNSSIGMDAMNATPGFGASRGTPGSDDDATRQRIKAGEDLENADAQQAGFGPSPTDGMSCTTTRSFSGSANSGTATSHTECH